MANLSKNTQLRFLLNGTEVNAAVEWAEIEISAYFENDNVEANLEIQKFTFVREAYRDILQYIEAGNNGGVGIFEGIPFQIIAFNKNQDRIAFDGYLDLSDEFEILEEEQKVVAKIVKKESLNNLESRIESLTVGYLESIGAITEEDYTDIEYVVEQPVSVFEIISSKIIFYVLVQELINQVREIARDISNAAGEAAGGLTGAIGSAILSVASVVFQIAYAASILSALLELGRDLFNSFLSPVRTHKSIILGTLFRRILSHLGLTLQTDIELIDRLAYLPSNINVDVPNRDGFLERVGTIEKGIPNETDFGYNVSEVFDLVKRLFFAKYSVRGSTLLLYSENSPFWVRQADYRIEDVLRNKFSYNTKDLKANVFVTFETDLRDLFTIQNFKGTSFGVNTQAITVNETQANFIKGFKEFRIPVCLGNRKDELNGLERTLRSVGNTFDDITSVFGGRSNFSNRIKNRIGSLKVSENNTSIPKLIYLDESFKIPQNHRDLLSARVLWENFHSYTSFVQDNFDRQRRLYENESIPFGFEDFLKVIQNSYFRDTSGSVGKITKLNWKLGVDNAIVSYWIPEVYTRNLTETFIEQE